jgi:hypothetical protein
MPLPSAHALKPLDSSPDHYQTSLRVHDNVGKKRTIFVV